MGQLQVPAAKKSHRLKAAALPRLPAMKVDGQGPFVFLREVVLMVGW